MVTVVCILQQQQKIVNHHIKNKIKVNHEVLGINHFQKQEFMFT